MLPLFFSLSLSLFFVVVREVRLIVYCESFESLDAPLRRMKCGGGHKKSLSLLHGGILFYTDETRYRDIQEYRCIKRVRESV